MAGPAGANAPPVGVVIKEDDGSHSIWNGKQWLPAAQGAGGAWGVDKGRMANMGLGGSAGAISPEQEKEVGAMRQDAAQTDTLATNANDFMRRNQRTATGGVLALPFASKIAKALNLPGTDDLAQMDRDNIASATMMRAPGMRLTQMEFGKFLGATPSVQNAGPQNRQMTDSINHANAMAQAKAAFFSSYLDTHRTLAGAIPAWLGWRNKHFGEDGTYMPDTPTPRAAGNTALKARSAQARGPVVLDLNGNPVPQ